MTEEMKEGRIHRLDNLTANQIAAGEVIERPVSVVKELIENAIDAGGTRIKAEIREGGLEQIRITDNGVGIYGRDLSLAVERHATSKLTRIQDLDDLRTLGFRGEALASIASVASLEIITRRQEEVQGSRLFVRGEDQEPVVGAAGCPAGTCITVEHLFFNTPARLKFMKTPGYEAGLIHDLLIQMALGYPEIDFSLENQGKKILDTAGINNVPDLVELFYGKDARGALVPAVSPVSESRLQGFVTAPPYSRGTRKGIHVFVNGRRISIKDMQWSIERAFEFLLPRGRFPVAVFQFRIPGHLLDVNVHPGKLEVRINDKGLFASLTRVLKQAISGGQLLPDAGDLGGAAGGKNGFSAERTNVLEEKTRKSAQGQQSFKNFNDQPGGFQTREWEQLYNFPARGEGELAEALPPDGAGRSGDGAGSFGSALAGENSCLGTGAADIYAAGTAAADALCAGADFNAAEGGAGKDEENASPAGERRSFACRACENPDARLCCLEERSPEETKNRWGVEVHTKTLQQMARACEPENFIFNPGIRFKIIGQLHDTFILAEVDSGLLVVDQHVAHERIIYEQLTAKEQILESEGPKAAQMLAIPVSVSLTSLEEEVLVKNIITLNDMGLILERFGPRSYVIRSLPAGQRVLDPDMFKDLLAQLAEAGGRAEAQEARQRLLVMMSCKQAVKANTRLSEEEMLALLQGLQKTRNPMTCPHGRPIMYLLPFNRLLRAFGRSL